MIFAEPEFSIKEHYDENGSQSTEPHSIRDNYINRIIVLKRNLRGLIKCLQNLW
jgi:hypothetical protein